MKPLETAYQLLEETILLGLSFWDPLLDRLLDGILSTSLATHPKPQIILVDSWLHKTPVHWFWRWYLERKGHPTAVLYFPLDRYSYSQSAAALKRHLDDHHLDSIVLVGISSGGLTCLYYLQCLNGWERVRQFIGIGCPFQGTSAAVLLYRIRNARAMLPNSAFLHRLHARPLQHLERITNLVAVYDELVPRQSSCLPGTSCRVIDVVGHGNLNETVKSTYDLVAALAER